MGGARVLEPVAGVVEESLGLLDGCEQICWVGAGQEKNGELRGGPAASAFEFRWELLWLLKNVCGCPLDLDAFGFQPCEPAPEHPMSRVGSPVVLLAPVAR